MARSPEATAGKRRPAKASLRGGFQKGAEVAFAAPDGPAFELHLSVEDLSNRWGMSEDFVRRLFLDEPGVVIFCNPRPGRRIYRTLRIPESVAARVYRRIAIA